MSGTNELLAINIINGPVITGFFVLSAALFVYLLVRSPTRRWLVTSAVALVAGFLLAVLVWFFVVPFDDIFGIPISHNIDMLFAATVVCVSLAIVNLWNSRWWRKVAAGLAIVVFLITGILGINADFGLNPTLGSPFGVVGENSIDLPSAGSTTPSGQSAPLWQTWKPPADIPTKGTVGTQVIPNTISGFNSRPAGIYLPPAALVPHAPPLPLMIMMMGQPGAPDPSYAAHVLDQFAAKHDGLAPIVIVADQLGNPLQDPLCLDTEKFGNARTFITQDVVNWALANLNIIHDHAYWTIAGYSNGGSCAISFIAEYPNLWSNVLDISGEEFPGSEDPDSVLAHIFDGDHAAYDAVKPENMLVKKQLPDTVGIFTVGSNDTTYIPGVKRMAAAATAAGMHSIYYESPNGGHVLPALTDGLTAGFKTLYPRLGLSEGPP